jgi:chromosome partitioning protein
MHVICAGMKLYHAEPGLIENQYGNQLLRQKLSELSQIYDFILIDCPPALSVYTRNALIAADGVIIPLLFEILSIQGLEQVLSTIQHLRITGNPNVQVIGALGVIVNENRKLTEEVLHYIRDNYNINVFNNYVRNNVKAAEAPSFAESVIDYAPNSSSARDYTNITSEFLAIITQLKQSTLKT